MNDFFQADVGKSLAAQFIGYFCRNTLSIWHCHVICLDGDRLQIVNFALEQGCKPILELESSLIEDLAILHFLFPEAPIDVVNIDETWGLGSH